MHQGTKKGPDQQRAPRQQRTRIFINTTLHFASIKCADLFLLPTVHLSQIFSEIPEKCGKFTQAELYTPIARLLLVRELICLKLY